MCNGEIEKHFVLSVFDLIFKARSFRISSIFLQRSSLYGKSVIGCLAEFFVLSLRFYMLTYFAYGFYARMHVIVRFEKSVPFSITLLIAHPDTIDKHHVTPNLYINHWHKLKIRLFSFQFQNCDIIFNFLLLNRSKRSK